MTRSFVRFFLRIVKEIAKVIDVNDVDRVMFSMLELINVFHKININQVQEVESMSINDPMIRVV